MDKILLPITFIYSALSQQTYYTNAVSCLFKTINYTSAPRMSINGEEVTSDNLIDNDVTSCELLPVGDGCRMDKVCKLN